MRYLSYCDDVLTLTKQTTYHPPYSHFIPHTTIYSHLPHTIGTEDDESNFKILYTPTSPYSDMLYPHILLGTEDDESNFKILCGLAEIHLLDNQLTALSKKQIKIRLAESVVVNNDDNVNNLNEWVEGVDGLEEDDDDATSKYSGAAIRSISMHLLSYSHSLDSLLFISYTRFLLHLILLINYCVDSLT